MHLRNTGILPVKCCKAGMSGVKSTCRCMKVELRHVSFVPGVDCGNVCPACPKVNSLNISQFVVDLYMYTA